MLCFKNKNLELAAEITTYKQNCYFNFISSQRWDTGTYSIQSTMASLLPYPFQPRSPVIRSASPQFRAETLSLWGRGSWVLLWAGLCFPRDFAWVSSLSAKYQLQMGSVECRLFFFWGYKAAFDAFFFKKNLWLVGQKLVSQASRLTADGLSRHRGPEMLSLSFSETLSISLKRTENNLGVFQRVFQGLAVIIMGTFVAQLRVPFFSVERTSSCGSVVTFWPKPSSSIYEALVWVRTQQNWHGFALWVLPVQD